MKNGKRRLVLCALIISCSLWMFAGCTEETSHEAVVDSTAEDDITSGTAEADDEIVLEEITDSEDEDVVSATAVEAPSENEMTDEVLGDIVRCYITFTCDETGGDTLEDCIGRLEEALTVCDVFEVRRIDETGHAIVANVGKGDVDVIKNLSFVESVEIMDEAETTGEVGDATVSE